MLVLMKFTRCLLIGRSGELRDILIDTSGVIVGIGLVYGIRKLWIKFHKKTTKNSTKNLA